MNTGNGRLSLSGLVFDETGNISGSDSVAIFILSSFAFKVFVIFAVSDSVFGANGVAMGGSSDFGAFTWVVCTLTTFTLVLWLVTFFFFLTMILVTGRGGRFVVLLFVMGMVVTVAVTVAGGVATDAGTPTATVGTMAVAIVTADSDVVVGRMIVGMGATTMDSSFLCLVGSIGT